MSEIHTLESGRDERSQVERWRLHVLVVAGYPVDLAEQLAATEVDLHEAVDLVEQGCAAEIAARILL